jgi:hypothetical protein
VKALDSGQRNAFEEKVTVTAWKCGVTQERSIHESQVHASGLFFLFYR